MLRLGRRRAQYKNADRCPWTREDLDVLCPGLAHEVLGNGSLRIVVGANSEPVTIPPKQIAIDELTDRLRSGQKIPHYTQAEREEVAALPANLQQERLWNDFRDRTEKPWLSQSAQKETQPKAQPNFSGGTGHLKGFSFT